MFEPFRDTVHAMRRAAKITMRLKRTLTFDFTRAEIRLQHNNHHSS